MGKSYDAIPDHLFNFLLESHFFLVATSPLNGGSVNVSPKANNGTFEIVNKNRVRYLDLSGSGNETISHLIQPKNGRITLAFMNIEKGLPNIVRLFGKGTVFERGLDENFDQKWKEVHGGKDVPVGARAIIDIAVHTCLTSCGYSMPIYEFKRTRTNLDVAMAKYQSMPIEQVCKLKGVEVPEGGKIEFYEKDDDHSSQTLKQRPMQDGLEVYWAISNALSIDGLPGLKSIRSALNSKEQDRLITLSMEHDNLQSPQESLGPLKPINQQQSQPTKIASQFIHQNVNYTHIAFAFTAGCALSFAILSSQT